MLLPPHEPLSADKKIPGRIAGDRLQGWTQILLSTWRAANLGLSLMIWATSSSLIWVLESPRTR